ncbi:hypothetical protein ACHAW5_007977 [Stephanodiscus triporus]|uniref:Uncharacterized protein n=1 Tax=Stephanodiscus triporus TaxID=2934178 RepID=A0ABD3QPB6_9STRA
MYSHVVDALARSTNPEHVRLADALLRQFVSLCVGRRRRDGRGDDAVDDERDANARSDEDDASAEESVGIEEGARRRSSDRTIAKFKRPGALRWNDRDGHHFPNQIRITGVMRGYARLSRPRDAERLLDLMTSLSSSSSSSSSSSASGVDRRDRAMFRPNDVGYATVIDAYSRSRDGPNAERVLGTMKRRGGGEADDDDDGRDDNRANVVAYNAAVSAWARSARDGGSSCRTIAPTRAEISSSRSAAENAERLLREM